MHFPIRLGILGCGSFVQRRILPILKEIEDIQLVAIQKQILSDAQKLADKYQIRHAVSSREELLTIPEIDAVFIATPNHLHEEDALACAAHAKPTLCEKPLAPTVLSIERMIEAFQKQSVPLYVGQSLRFKYCVQKAKEILQSGRLGELLNIRAHFSLPVPKENWRHLQSYSGGVLQDIGVHLIDLIRFVSGQQIKTISALANDDYQTSTIEAIQTVSAICRLESHAMAAFECSFLQPFSSGFEIVGTKARLISTDSLRQSDDSLETLCLQENDTKLYFPIRAGNIYVEELRHFANVLKGFQPTVIPAIEGLQNQKVIEAAYRSIDKGVMEIL